MLYTINDVSGVEIIAHYTYYEIRMIEFKSDLQPLNQEVFMNSRKAIIDDIKLCMLDGFPKHITVKCTIDDSFDELY